jgi:DNA-binding transcriptional MerR regulator
VDKAPDAFRTISEVGEELDLPQHVLRFWETRFSQIRPMKRGGGRRYYRPDDIDLLRGIRHLLYGEGYTIRGVQRILKDHGVKFVQSVWQAGAPQPSEAPGDAEEVEAAGDKAPRSRRLFSPLPPMPDENDGASASDARREAPIEDLTQDEEAAEGDASAEIPAMPLHPRRPQAAAPARSVGEATRSPLAADDLRKLKATLGDLTECRRLLDAALAEQA